MQRTVDIQGEIYHFWAHAFVEENEDGKAGANQDAPVQVRCECKGTDKGNDGDCAIMPLGLPGMDKSPEVY